MADNNLVGFADLNAVSDNDEDNEITNMKNKNKVSKKSGGFQSMGLSFSVLKGILKRGYKVPTPIQRKVMLLIKSIFNLFKVLAFNNKYCLFLIDYTIGS